jgi:DNA-binding XRE family transcriptional regulator
LAGARRPKVTKALGEVFTDQLRRRRKRAELTQAQLAQKAGVAAGTVSNAELGRAIPRAKTVRKLATALGVRGITHKRFMDAANTTVVAAAKRSSVQHTLGMVGSGGRVRRALQIFLCHSSGDKNTVRALYQRLKREPGISPWLDEENLLPGQD